MKRYIGTKIIHAEPRDKNYGPAEQQGQSGYTVVYPDGYTSWSPAAAFEEAYRERPLVEGLAPHQQRVVDEKADLDERREKLQAFYSAPVFHGLPESEQSSLFGQGVAMRTYSEILAERIARF